MKYNFIFFKKKSFLQRTFEIFISVFLSTLILYIVKLNESGLMLILTLILLCLSIGVYCTYLIGPVKILKKNKKYEKLLAIFSLNLLMSAIFLLISLILLFSAKELINKFGIAFGVFALVGAMLFLIGMGIFVLTISDLLDFIIFEINPKELKKELYD